MWIGSPGGGIWKTIDGGLTWSTNTDNLPVLGISDIVIDPTNKQIMYAATGDADGGATYSIGILKSVDGGKVLMRKDDHQIHFDMQALLVSEKTDQSILYRNRDFDMSYVNIGNIPMENITLDTTCDMKRP